MFSARPSLGYGTLIQYAEASVNDALSEEELGSLAGNIGSLNHTRGGYWDTEADLPDRSVE